MKIIIPAVVILVLGLALGTGAVVVGIKLGEAKLSGEILNAMLANKSGMAGDFVITPDGQWSEGYPVNYIWHKDVHRPFNRAATSSARHTGAETRLFAEKAPSCLRPLSTEAAWR